jgi:hypothetical protein
MVDMLLSDEDPAAIEAFKKALGIVSVNAHLLAAQEAAERQAECAQSESWVHFLASRHFSRRPIAVMVVYVVAVFVVHERQRIVVVLPFFDVLVVHERHRVVVML